MPWKNVRCSNLTCSFDHLWGRVRWFLKEKSKTTEFSAPHETSSGGGGPESIRDDVTATSDLPDVGFNVSSIQIDDTVGVEVDSDLSDENLDEDDSDDTKSDNTDGSGF
jgi:hypothetical protein